MIGTARSLQYLHADALKNLGAMGDPHQKFKLHGFPTTIVAHSDLTPTSITSPWQFALSRYDGYAGVLGNHAQLSCSLSNIQ